MIIKTDVLMKLSIQPKSEFFTTHSCYCGCMPEIGGLTFAEAMAAGEDFVEGSFYIFNEIVAENEISVSFDCGVSLRKEDLEIVSINDQGWVILAH